MRKILILGVICCLADSVASAQKAGDFVFKRDIDLITDDDISYFYATALNSEESSSYSPRLVMGCRNKKPYVYVNAKTSIHEYKNDKVATRIRFDQQKPSDTISWLGDDSDRYIVHVPSEMRGNFIKQALKAQQIVIQFTDSDNETKQFQFGLNKLDFMLSKLVCGKEFLK